MNSLVQVHATALRLRVRNSIQFALILLLISTFSLGCRGSPGSRGFTSSGRNPSGLSVKFVTFQGLQSSGWLLDAEKKLYTNNRQITLTGTCTGVGTFRAFQDSQQIGPNISCTAAGTYNWTFTAPTDGSYTLDFKTPDNTKIISQTFVVDTVPPASPIILTNGGANITLEVNGNLLLEGTSSADSVNVTVISALGIINYTPSQHQFNYSQTLAWGSESVLRFVATDFAGNVSSPTQITVNYLTALTLSIFSQDAGLGSLTKVGAEGIVTLDAVGMSPLAVGPVTSQEGTTKLYTGVTAMHSN